MTEDQDTQTRGRGTRILATLAVLAAAAGLLTVTSLALFTDQETTPGNAFSTGTIDLTAAPASAVVNMANMAPGDQVTRTLDVINSGSLEFRYSTTSETTEDTLASALVMNIKSGVVTCDDANWMNTGAPIYTGPLGSVGVTQLWGNATQGQQPGDRVLPAGANEVLCVNVTLPLATTNALAGRGTTAVFTFDAEQTANNP